jgi:hypothetical protein
MNEWMNEWYISATGCSNVMVFNIVSYIKASGVPEIITSVVVTITHTFEASSFSSGFTSILCVLVNKKSLISSVIPQSSLFDFLPLLLSSECLQCIAELLEFVILTSFFVSLFYPFISCYQFIVILSLQILLTNFESELCIDRTGYHPDI